MKYFSKYLKVEGKATVNGCNQCEIGDVIKIREDSYRYLGNNEFEKVKLFLCSIHKEIGDKITQDGIKYTEWCKSHEGLEDALDTYFKVIGEISKEAIWIKEGEEFDEEDIKIIGDRYYSTNSSQLTNEEVANIAKKENKEVFKVEYEHGDRDEHSRTIYTIIYWRYPTCIKIKCATCKTFH